MKRKALKLTLLVLLVLVLVGAVTPVTVEFRWKPAMTGGDATGYEIAYGLSAGSRTTVVDAGKPTLQPDGTMRFQISGWDASVLKFAVVRAYNSFGRSDDSTELKLGKPGTPDSFNVVVTPGM